MPFHVTHLRTSAYTGRQVHRVCKHPPAALPAARLKWSEPSMSSVSNLTEHLVCVTVMSEPAQSGFRQSTKQESEDTQESSEGRRDGSAGKALAAESDLSLIYQGLIQKK